MTFAILRQQGRRRPFRGVMDDAVFWAPLKSDVRDHVEQRDGSFTRASNAWFRKGNHLFEVGSGVPRFEAKGLLFEPAATNICRQSNALGTSPWAVTNASVTQDQTGPDGTTSAWTIDDSDTTVSSFPYHCGNLYGNETVANDSSRYVASVFMRKKPAPVSVFPVFGITIQNGTTEIIGLASFNPYTGDIQAASGTGWTPNPAYDTAWVEDYGDWWRVSLSVANNSSGNTLLRPRFYPSYSSTLGGAPNAALTGSQVAWQFDIVAARTPSSPITTAASSVTRAVDALSWPTRPSGFDANAGFCLADFEFIGPTSIYASDTVNGIFSISSAKESLMRLIANYSGGGTSRCVLENDTGGTNPAYDFGSANGPIRGVTRWDGSVMQAGSDAGSGFGWSATEVYAGHPDNNQCHIGQGVIVPIWIKNVRLFNRDASTSEIEGLYAL